jgi:ubiquitin-protein ligase
MKRQKAESNAKWPVSRPEESGKQTGRAHSSSATTTLRLQYAVQSVLVYCVCDKTAYLTLTRVSRLWRDVLVGRRSTCALLDAQIIYALWPEWRLHAFHAPVNNLRGVASMTSRLCRNIRAHHQFLSRANTCLLKLECEWKGNARTPGLSRSYRACSWHTSLTRSDARISTAGTFFARQYVVLPIICRECSKARGNTCDWLIMCVGPPDSRYAGGLFVFHMTLSVNTWHPPIVRLLTDVTHPNVRAPTRRIDIDMFKQDWSPSMRLATLLAVTLQSLLDSPILDTCVDMPRESVIPILEQVVSNAHMNQAVIPSCPCTSSSTPSGAVLRTPVAYLEEFALLSFSETAKKKRAL